ncbi:dynein family protein [Aspergillus candidus]|uniref:Dynein light intermediate chain-domain-containing protein n=1 Tax=Aspergillus candidus TaxID=41067 RepID=A0A2I2FK35_ASPCN|nr:dynein light intermediate chain-domain-containing protein [Aspergillus candidus]PLB40997.1 dynein light intermediate chain-domain-containing protein [Aspergillus candidus]
MSTSRFGSGTGSGSNSRPSSKDGPKKNMWSSMLDSVANGKRLPEKNLLILGGTPESQREFLNTFSADTTGSGFKNDKRKGGAPPVANQFALGYTYLDVLDADHEDTLARVSAYLLSEPSLSFAPLLKPLLTPQSVPETLVVILLDWSDPWTWVRRLREWVRLLRHVLVSLDDPTKIVMEETMTEWRDRKRGMDSGAAGAQGLASSGGPVSIPLGPGEWDEGLGVPLCVVCQGADKIEKMEKEHGWREEEFDFILQFLRTLLLKHGASLIYTTPFLANSLQSLLHSSLGIHSLLKRQSLKHNVIDRDKILVPANWDSWGKIRIIREGFDMEGISTAWSIEIQDPPEPLPKRPVGYQQDEQQDPSADDGTSAVTIFEQTIKDPKRDTSLAVASQQNKDKIEVETTGLQSFLEKQLEVLEQLKTEDEQDRSTRPAPQLEMSPMDDSGRVNEHIGPVQFNMGGIQVDADDMLRKLKEREATRTSQRKETISSPGDEKAHNQALKNFFAGLVKKPSTSPRESPST